MTPEEHLTQVISDIKKDVKTRAINVREICRTTRDTLRSLNPALEITVDLGSIDRLDIDRVTDLGWGCGTTVYLRIERAPYHNFHGLNDVPTKKMSKADIDAYLIAFFNDEMIANLFNALEEK